MSLNEKGVFWSEIIMSLRPKPIFCKILCNVSKKEQVNTTTNIKTQESCQDITKLYWPSSALRFLCKTNLL